MQKCTNCGSELPNDARFCGLCGHEPDRVSTIDKETIRSNAENGQQPGDVAALSTQELARSVESKNGKHADDVAVLSTKELAGSKEGEKIEGSTPAALVTEGGYVPPGFSEVDKVQNQAAAAPIVSPASPQPLPTSSPAPKARRGSAVRWVMIAVVCLLVLAGIAGGLLFLLRPQGTTTTITPAVGSSPTVSNTVGTTRPGTNCPKNSIATSCITPVTGTTPVAGTKAVFNITLSGALQGPMTVTSMARCGPTTSGTEYDLYFSGTSGGATYNFVARIPAYKGPADYNTGQISVVFAQQPIATTTVWGNSGNVPAKATINADTKSGTLDITLTGATNTLHVSGDWACA